MRRVVLLAIILCTVNSESVLFAQSNSTYRFTGEFLAGSSLSTIAVYQEDDMNIIGFTGAVRLMWEPEKLLRLGVEGGFIHLAHSKEENIITDFGTTTRSNSLNAYPVMLHFNMKIWKMELMLGIGAALISSKINAFNDVSESSVITSSKMYGLGYTLPISERVSVGCEFKIYSFSTPDITVSTLQLKGKYAFLIW